MRAGFDLLCPRPNSGAQTAMTGSAPACGVSPEEWAQILEPLVGPPQIVARPVIAQRLEIIVFGVSEEGIERLARGSFDQDREHPRFDACSRLYHSIQAPERHALTAVLVHSGDRTA